MAKKKKKKM
jgi:hypothetical protein